MQIFRVTEMVDRIWESPGRTTWAQRIVVFGVLMASAVLGARGSTSINRLVIVAVAGAAGLLALLRWPNLGLVGALLGGFFVAYSGPGGVNVAVGALAGSIGLWIMDMIVRQRKLTLIDRQTATPVMVFIVSALLSFGVGQLPWYPMARHAPMTAQIGGLAIFLISALTLLMVANTVRELKWLQIITWTFMAISALYITGRLMPPVARIFARFFQPGATTGALFWVWMMVIPFSQALLNKRLHILVRAALMAFVAAALYVAVIRTSDWKSGYLPPLAGMAVILALILKRKVVWFIPVGLALAWLLGTEAIATDQYSYVTRLDAWRIVIQLSLVSPIFGIGFANYYWYTHLFPIMGWHVAFNSHSQYVDIFSQTGLFGLATFFWIFWAVARLGWDFHERAPEGFARAYVYGALGGLVGTLVAGGLVDWVLPFPYNIGMNGFRSSMLSWIFLGGLVAVRYMPGPPSGSGSSDSVSGRET